jgi:hypothetical protein
MSAADRRVIPLGSETHRKFVGSLVANLERGWVVTLDPPRRTIPQNSTLHMLIADAVAGGLATDTGRRLTQEEAKVAFVTGWMVESGHESDIVAFSGHPVQLRRSTATFDKAEFASLIEYIMAECAQRGIALRDPADYLR